MSAANHVTPKRAEYSEETKKKYADRLRKMKADALHKRWNAKPGTRSSLKLMKAGSYAMMDCGCIIKIINYTKQRGKGSIRPLLVIDNDKCDRMAGPVECRLITGDKDCPGIWRRRTPGYKAHVIGTTFYDIGQEVTAVDGEKLKAKWRKELKNGG